MNDSRLLRGNAEERCAPSYEAKTLENTLDAARRPGGTCSFPATKFAVVK
jgi:hypothetical protein